MEKYYKKFHEVGNNAYYVLDINDTQYLAIESFIEGKSPILKRTKRMQQGLKLLELNPCISILLQCVYTSEPLDVDEEFPDMTTYKTPKAEDIRKTIHKFYTKARDDEIIKLENWYTKRLEVIEYPNNGENKKELIEEATNYYKETKESLLNLDMFKGIIIDYDKMLGLCNLRGNSVKDIDFLYIHKYTTIYNVAYMYSIDTFGTVIIYRFDIVNGIIKGAESFIINREVLNRYYEYVYNENI